MIGKHDLFWKNTWYGTDNILLQTVCVCVCVKKKLPNMLIIEVCSGGSGFAALDRFRFFYKWTLITCT